MKELDEFQSIEKWQKRKGLLRYLEQDSWDTKENHAAALSLCGLKILV